jgi:leucyl-tRNA synthetase
MAVPAHDAREFEFAKTFNLPMRQVVSPNDGKEWDQDEAYSGDGTLVNSSYEFDINGLSTSEAASKVIQWLEQNGSGKKQVRGLVGPSPCCYRSQ